MAKTYTVMRFHANGEEPVGSGISRAEAQQLLMRHAVKYQGVVAIVADEDDNVLVNEVYYRGQKVDPQFVHTILYSLGKYM